MNSLKVKGLNQHKLEAGAVPILPLINITGAAENAGTGKVFQYLRFPAPHITHLVLNLDIAPILDKSALLL